MKSNHINEYASSGTSPARRDPRKHSSTAQNLLVDPADLRAYIAREKGGAA
jgi:hypothetical protein